MNDDGYQFHVGDIVREKDFITIGYDDQMTGIEEMPDVLVELVSSVINTKKR